MMNSHRIWNLLKSDMVTLFRDIYIYIGRVTKGKRSHVRSFVTGQRHETMCEEHLASESVGLRLTARQTGPSKCCSVCC